MTKKKSTHGLKNKEKEAIKVDLNSKVKHGREGDVRVGLRMISV